jgi:hypothetical protein
MLAAASGVACSTAGFFTRLIPPGAWTILFWRGLFVGGFIATATVLHGSEDGRNNPNPVWFQAMRT